ncbi:hypothetical protein [Candidatus Rhodoblastus alkanivorans]|uniref:Uncharacterized protein n=1 Tax=Candidatus Rhodoblastus alkanivorans TaxID=2954117 RepID=A0ABS9Z9L4_9HYPH|nr:hypothetical protein [Candidatus Rhodoblastus alkanivorans]MCI4684385.1 hypothetical protein [Candidatus Rhodoblastus alkanivorans]
MEHRQDDNSGEDGLGAGEAAQADRRKFLSTLGRFAAATPPAITMLLSTSLTSQAIAHSGGRSWGPPGDPPHGGPPGGGGWGPPRGPHRRDDDD